jgi:hypothetical protein
LTGRPLLFHSNEFQIRFTRKKSIIFSFSVWNSENKQAQQPYQHQQDFSQLTSLGLQVMQQGDNLIVVGKNQFENKTAIRNAGFFWNSENKTWFIPLRQAA